MPIVRINRHLVYYCHVPKAAGSAMEAYLAAQFGPLAFADGAFYAVEEAERWTRSSPQHVDTRSLGRLFPNEFFDEVFAVVRHPVGRLVSAYKFQKFAEKLIPAETRFEDWVQGLSKSHVERRWAFDNHLLPMSLLVPETCRTFRLEDGLEPVIDYLQGLAGPEVDLPRKVEPVNVMIDRLRWMGVEDEVVVIGEETRRHIAHLYRDDFERFGYAMADTPTETPAGPLPATASDAAGEPDTAVSEPPVPAGDGTLEAEPSHDGPGEPVPDRET